MRTKLTILITKSVGWILQKLGRGGSFPGILALRLHPTILQDLTYPKQVILLTGTNGKTTTTNMLYDVLQQSGYQVVANLKGDNLKVGVATAILKHTSINKRVKADVLLLEVDELSVPKVMKDVPITHMLVKNFFRDQLDRAGEMENVIRRIEKALEDFNGTLYLNGDDPNVVRLNRYHQPVKYYGVDKNKQSQSQSDESSEGKFCIHCGRPLHYEYYQYSHIGRFYCTCEHGKRVNYDLEVREVDIEEGLFTVDDHVFEIKHKALYFIYNCAAILLVSNDFQVPYEVQRNVFMNFDRMNGRNETYQLKNGQTLILNLVKNPTGTNEVLKAINQDEEEKVVMMILNDNDQDGKDVSWIWDAHFQRLADDKVKKVYCSGLRAYDLALRLKYSGQDIEFEVHEDLATCLDAMCEHHEKYYVISTYTALQKMRGIIKEYV